MGHSRNISKQELFSALEKKHKDIDTILHTISHDLRGPVSTILGINNIIDPNSTKEELSQYLGSNSQTRTRSG